MSSLVSLRNVRLCIDGQLHPPAQLDIDTGTGKIVESGDRSRHNTIDLGNAIIAPGFLELQTNGLRGFHFTHFTDQETYMENLKRVAEYLPRLSHPFLPWLAMSRTVCVATMLFKSNPEKCILITDSIELAGLPDDTYPGHAQVSFNQTK
ncbi:hypothetical protein AC579_7880 [Pseudocercospora musae]|uniref:Amidohydrolase-related domain-containing protein n=1 Tax=Pseudocercospora musae TaxID=113226 RepID=A0A139I6V8_9PEZI|nr:hypothetical protein AC579_7880 [Pseudocercospora musae]